MREIIVSCCFLFGIFSANAQITNRTIADRQHDTRKGILSAEEFSRLKKILSSNITDQLKDTIIIKYDVNSSQCWYFLDAQKDEYINRVLDGTQTQMRNQLVARPYRSVFRFREKGNRVNKLIKWNNDIKVDEEDALRSLLFKKHHSSCGTGAIIFPNGEYLLVLDDSHFEALTFTKEQIEEAMGRRK